MSELKAITSVFNIEIEKIDPNPNQPRKYFNDEALRDLSESIRRYGVMQPITVFRRETETPEGGIITRYEIIAGERRWRASVLAGMNSIPAIIHEEEASEQERYELSILENLQREDLNPVDKARSFERLSVEFGMKHAEIADKLGKSREYVTNSMRLLVLPEHMLDALSNGYISEGHTRPLLSLKDKPEQMEVLFQEITTKGLNVRDAEKVGRELSRGDGASRTQIKAQLDLDPEMLDLQKQLAASLGTAVSIDKKDQGGKVVIDFFSRDDLKKLLSIIGKSGVADLLGHTQADIQKTLVDESPVVTSESTPEPTLQDEQVVQTEAPSVGVTQPIADKTEPNIDSTVDAGTDTTIEPTVGASSPTTPLASLLGEKTADSTPSQPDIQREVSSDAAPATPNLEPAEEEDDFFKAKTLHVLDSPQPAAQPVNTAALNRQREIDNLVSQTTEHTYTPMGETTKPVDLGDLEPVQSVYAEQAIQPSGTTTFQGEIPTQEPAFGETTPYVHTDAQGAELEKSYPGTKSEPVFGDTNSFIPETSSLLEEPEVSISGDEFIPESTKPSPNNTQGGSSSSAEVTMGGLDTNIGAQRSDNDEYNLTKFSL